MEIIETIMHTHALRWVLSLVVGFGIMKLMEIRYGKMIIYSGVGVLMYYLIYRTMTYSGNIPLSLIFFVIGSGCLGFAWFLRDI